MTDFVALKERRQQAWSTGDFGIIARTSVIVGVLLCEAVDLRPGQQVLAVATGTGNTALAAARRGCEVIGLDWAAPLLARGRERAAAEQLPVTFRAGEAEQLPFPDGSFDTVLSTLGPCMPPTKPRRRAKYSGSANPGARSA
jgi:2-polyprenyl-3-methyl-5-hydroxy-6-metoxy-1,4-benzoquinol methylase